MKEKKAQAVRPGLWLWRVSGRYKGETLCLLLVQIALAMLGVWQAWILRDLVDYSAAHDRDGYLRFVLLLAGVILAQLLLRAVLRFLKEHTRSGLENRFKGRLFRTLLEKDYACVTATHSQEWMNRLTTDTVVVAEGLTEIVPDVIGMAVRLAAGLGSVLVLVHGLRWFLVPSGLLLAAFATLFRRRLKDLHREIREADGRLRVLMSERLSSLLIVRAFARENVTAEQAGAAMDDHRAARMRRSHFSNFCNVCVGLLIQGTYLFGAVTCARGILNGTMGYGSFAAVLDLIRQIQSPFANISGYLPRYFAMLASAERLMEAEAFPEDRPEAALPAEEIRAVYREGLSSIRLKDVGFTYRPPAAAKETAMPVVLSGVNLEIRKGEFLAVTGPSGCGKSTLLKLLMCLYPLDAGEQELLLSDGPQPLTAAWRGLFAYVPQGNQLLCGTIREVVAFGDPEKMAEESALWEALRMADAETFVRELPRGLDAPLGEAGSGLSEGQMQRLAIARAILSGRPILLLDEATSSLDETAEANVLRNIRSLTDRTVLIVTHRPKALSICTKQIRMTAEGIIEKELLPRERDT